MTSIDDARADLKAAKDALDVSFPIPDDADAIRELYTDTAKMAELASKHGGDGFARIAEAYRAAAAIKDAGEMDEQIAIEAERQALKMIRDHGGEPEGGRLNLTADKVERIVADNAARVGRKPRYNESAPGAKVDEIGASYGDVIRGAIAQANPTAFGRWDDRADVVAKVEQVRNIQAAYSSHIPSSGGVLLPESFRNQLLMVAHEQAVVRPRATTIPMSTPKVTIPKIRETTRASNLFGGITISWTEEAAAMSASEAAFGTVSLEPDTMTGFARIPNELMADTLAFEAYFSATFPEAMVYEEDYAFVQGGGVGEPLGFLNAGAVVEVAKESGQPADSLVYQNILNMYARLLPNSMNRAVWLINQDVIPELGEMALAVGTGGAPVWLLNVQSGLPPSMFGRPIIFTEKVNQLGDAGDVALVDLSFYLIGDLQAMTTASSEHFYFSTNETAFRIVSRVDGQPWIDSAITPRHGTNTLTPFVTIAERA